MQSGCTNTHSSTGRDTCACRFVYRRRREIHIVESSLWPTTIQITFAHSVIGHFLLSSSNFKNHVRSRPWWRQSKYSSFLSLSFFSPGESVHTITFLGLLQVFSSWTRNTNRRTACSSKSIRLPLTVMIPLPLFSLPLSLPQLSSNQHT